MNDSWNKIKEKLDQQRVQDLESWYSEKQFILCGNITSLLEKEIKKVYPNVIKLNIEDLLIIRKKTIPIVILEQTIRTNRTTASKPYS